MRIIRKYPAVDWKRIWRNLHTSGLSSIIKSTWDAYINDILPTHDRLAEIHTFPKSGRYTQPSIYGPHNDKQQYSGYSAFRLLPLEKYVYPSEITWTS